MHVNFACARLRARLRIYHASIGSDSTGKLLSDIQTEINRTKYKLVIAEVFPVAPKNLAALLNK